MKSMVLAACVVAIAALEGCGAEAPSSPDESPTSSPASLNHGAASSPEESLRSSTARAHQASVALNQFLSSAVVDQDGKIILPESRGPSRAVPVSVEDKPIWAICAYGGTVLPTVCCESDGTCSVTPPRS